MALFAIMAAMAKTKKMASLLRSAAPAVAGAVLLAAQPAEAKILEGYVDVYVGGMYGTPPKLSSVVTIKSEANGTTKGADFFDYNSGALLGLRGGLQFDAALLLRECKARRQEGEHGDGKRLRRDIHGISPKVCG